MEGKEEEEVEVEVEAPAALKYAEPRVWEAGTILEAEMMDPDFPNYIDTIHRVKVVERQENGDYRCKLLAFDESDDSDVWSALQLHEVREAAAEEMIHLKKGDEVHIRIKNREVMEEWYFLSLLLFFD